MSDYLYGFIDSNNRVLEFFVVKENDTETLERLKLESNAISFHKVNSIELEITGAKENQYWNGERFVWDSEYPSWVFDSALNSWIPPVPYPAVEEGSDEIYTWDENTTSWLLLPPSN